MNMEEYLRKEANFMLNHTMDAIQIKCDVSKDSKYMEAVINVNLVDDKGVAQPAIFTSVPMVVKYSNLHGKGNYTPNGQVSEKDARAELVLEFINKDTELPKWLATSYATIIQESEAFRTMLMNFQEKAMRTMADSDLIRPKERIEKSNLVKRHVPNKTPEEYRQMVKDEFFQSFMTDEKKQLVKLAKNTTDVWQIRVSKPLGINKTSKNEKTWADYKNLPSDHSVQIMENAGKVYSIPHILNFKGEDINPKKNLNMKQKLFPGDIVLITFSLQCYSTTSSHTGARLGYVSAKLLDNSLRRVSKTVGLDMSLMIPEEVQKAMKDADSADDLDASPYKSDPASYELEDDPIESPDSPPTEFVPKTPRKKAPVRSLPQKVRRLEFSPAEIVASAATLEDEEYDTL
jgi:hypothetical protein